jgi:hypothetical protein
VLVALAIPGLQAVQPKGGRDEQNEAEDHQLEVIGSTGARRAW